MTIGFAVSCLAILALAVVLVSVMVGLAIGVGQRWLKRLAPAAQSRILLAAALAPAFIGVVLLLAWNADILVFRCRAHGCIYEYAGAWPSAPLLLLLAILTTRVFLAGARAVAGIKRGRVLR